MIAGRRTQLLHPPNREGTEYLPPGGRERAPKRPRTREGRAPPVHEFQEFLEDQCARARLRDQMLDTPRSGRSVIAR